MADLPERSNARLFFWVGLIAITFLYGLYYFYFLNELAFTLALRARHAVKFLSILLAYGIGAFALRRIAAGWVLGIWHVTYALGLLLLLLLGVYDWGIARAPLGVRIVADDLQELLVSPILYCVVAMLNRSLGIGRHE